MSSISETASLRFGKALAGELTAEYRFRYPGNVNSGTPILFACKYRDFVRHASAICTA